MKIQKTSKILSFLNTFLNLSLQQGIEDQLNHFFYHILFQPPRRPLIIATKPVPV